MATRAFVLIEAMIGRNRKIVATLKQVKGVSSAEMVTGPYDVICIVEAETLGEIGDIVSDKIHPIEGICRTVTCLSL